MLTWNGSSASSTSTGRRSTTQAHLDGYKRVAKEEQPHMTWKGYTSIANLEPETVDLISLSLEYPVRVYESPWKLFEKHIERGVVQDSQQLLNLALFRRIDPELGTSSYLVRAARDLKKNTALCFVGGQLMEEWKSESPHLIDTDGHLIRAQELHAYFEYPRDGPNLILQMDQYYNIAKYIRDPCERTQSGEGPNVATDLILHPKAKVVCLVIYTLADILQDEEIFCVRFIGNNKKKVHQNMVLAARVSHYYHRYARKLEQTMIQSNLAQLLDLAHKQAQTMAATTTTKRRKKGGGSASSGISTLAASSSSSLSTSNKNQQLKLLSVYEQRMHMRGVDPKQKSVPIPPPVSSTEEQEEMKMKLMQQRKYRANMNGGANSSSLKGRKQELFVFFQRTTVAELENQDRLAAATHANNTPATAVDLTASSPSSSPAASNANDDGDEEMMEEKKDGSSHHASSSSSHNHSSTSSSSSPLFPDKHSRLQYVRDLWKTLTEQQKEEWMQKMLSEEKDVLEKQMKSSRGEEKSNGASSSSQQSNHTATSATSASSPASSSSPTNTNSKDHDDDDEEMTNTDPTSSPDSTTTTTNNTSSSSSTTAASSSSSSSTSTSATGFIDGTKSLLKTITSIVSAATTSLHTSTPATAATQSPNTPDVTGLEISTAASLSSIASSTTAASSSTSSSTSSTPLPSYLLSPPSLGYSPQPGQTSLQIERDLMRLMDTRSAFEHSGCEQIARATFGDSVKQKTRIAMLDIKSPQFPDVLVIDGDPYPFDTVEMNKLLRDGHGYDPEKLEVREICSITSPCRYFCPPWYRSFCVVSKVQIQKGDLLLIYSGEMEEQVQNRCSSYVYNLPTREGVSHFGKSYSVIPDLVVDAAKKGNIGRFINDNAFRNGEYQDENAANISVEWVYDLSSPHLVFYAKKAIGPGEELISSYGQEFWDVMCAQSLRGHSAYYSYIRSYTGTLEKYLSTHNVNLPARPDVVVERTREFEPKLRPYEPPPEDSDEEGGEEEEEEKATEKEKRKEKKNKKGGGGGEKKDNTDTNNSDDNVPSSDDEAPEFTVERIIGKKFDSRHRPYYLVKWLCYDKPEDNTWEPLTHLEGSQLFIQEFNEKLKKLGMKVGQEPLPEPPKADGDDEDGEEERKEGPSSNTARDSDTDMHDASEERKQPYAPAASSSSSSSTSTTAAKKSHKKQVLARNPTPAPKKVARQNLTREQLDNATSIDLTGEEEMVNSAATATTAAAASSSSSSSVTNPSVTAATTHELKQLLSSTSSKGRKRLPTVLSVEADDTAPPSKKRATRKSLTNTSSTPAASSSSPKSTAKVTAPTSIQSFFSLKK